MIKIRVSSLPYYADCPRKWARKSLPKEMLEGLGFETQPYIPYVYATMGTGTHTGVALALNRKIDGIVLPNPLDDLYQAGIESFRENIHDGVVWDKTTNNINTAEKQIQNVLRAYYHAVLPNIEPTGVELGLEAKIDDYFFLSGHMDANSEKAINDFKNGVRDPKASVQMGGYGILRIANNLGKPEELIIDHIPRTSLKKPQEMPKSIKYDVAVSMEEAKAIYKHIIRDTNEFMNSGDPSCFLANNHSNLCASKYCSAHGTNWCKLTK
ncbi:hypothetical protein LCGC14_1425420 [marine sediment metagenome]|uniref:PD-(D/E)XK endonuclease-like domain-containing protein n=1 Tax=marine sediment metagenome TaxID=412755 RepID=A0A0F9KB88_9ZZZZ